MNTVPPFRPVVLSAADEALELRDVGARDCTPTYGSEVTDADVDAMWVEEMARRDSEAGDDEPDPPTAGAVHPQYPTYRQQVARWRDDQLITGIGLADEGNPKWGTPDERAA